MTAPLIDLVSVGRVNMDLFSQDIGAEFADITGFDAMVGGSPTNIAIGTARLGWNAVAMTAVGDDAVGSFVVRYLRDAKVNVDYITTKPGKLTSLALLGVIPPSRFPLSFYRSDPADIYLSVDDVDAVPWDRVRAVQLSGNAFSRGPCVAATEHAGKRAVAAGADVYMDLDLRPTDWSAPTEFGRVLRDAMALCTVVIGTEEEFYAALMDDPETVMSGAAVPDHRHGPLDSAIDNVIEMGPTVLIVKRGPAGATIITAGDRSGVPGFPIEVVNTVGAGDSFASGLIARRLAGDGWEQSVRYANACGAITVTRHGCSVAFPTDHEVQEFVTAQGGW